MTIARFRVRHEQALAGLLVQSLKLCAAAGMVRLGLVALDGTKIAANAAAAANRTVAHLQAQVAELLAQAAAADRAEDREHGGAGGDALPRALASRAERLARLPQAKAQLEAEAAARQQRYQQRVAELAAAARARGQRPRAHIRPRRRDEAPNPRATVNTTDPDSRFVRGNGRTLQGYNAQAAATSEQVVVAAELTQQANDLQQLAPMLIAIATTLAAAGISDPVRRLAADSGYWSIANVSAIPEAPELLIPPARHGRHGKPRKDGKPSESRSDHLRAAMLARLASAQGKADYAQRSRTIEPVFGQVKMISGEGLQRGPVDVLGPPLYEAAHGLAHARMVSDTSRQGRYHNRRYHNRRYATLAAELGLEVAHMRPIGWSATSVPDQTAACYAEVLAELAAGLVLWRRAERERPGRAAPATPWPALVPVAAASGWPARCWSWPRSCAAAALNPSSLRTMGPVDAYQRVAERPRVPWVVSGVGHDLCEAAVGRVVDWERVKVRSTWARVWGYAGGGVSGYSRQEVARRAGVDPGYLDRLVELGILTPAAADAFSAGDALRARWVQSLERAGVPLEGMAAAVRDGALSFSFMDVPAFDRFAGLSGTTFLELSAQTGIPLELLGVVREAVGFAAPRPQDHVREDELSVVSAVEAQLLQGFQSVVIEGWLRVCGDSLRRIAETETAWWHSEVLMLLASGMTEAEMLAAQADLGSKVAPLTEQALVAIYHGQQEHAWTQGFVGLVEGALERAGLYRRLDRPPAVCFLDLTGYTRLTEERGDQAAAEVATRLATLVRRSAQEHGGTPVKWLGDGVMFYFREPAAAVLAALEMVEGVGSEGLPPAHVGIHAGPVIFQEGDYFGRTVNLAARIGEYARPGEVLVSQEVVDAADGGAVSFTEIGPVELKGVPGPLRLHTARRNA